MRLRTNAFDLWVFRRDPDQTRYLILHTSQEKADKWFSGDGSGRSRVGSLRKMREFSRPSSGYFRIFTSCPSPSGPSNTPTPTTIAGARTWDITPVFAAEVEGASAVPLTWEHSEYRWATASECSKVIGFRGLLEGLEWTRRYVSDQVNPDPVFRLA